MAQIIMLRSTPSYTSNWYDSINRHPWVTVCGEGLRQWWDVPESAQRIWLTKSVTPCKHAYRVSAHKNGFRFYARTEYGSVQITISFYDWIGRDPVWIKCEY